MTAPVRLSDDEVVDRLRDHLRTMFSAPALAYAESPTRVTGGFETSIFRFRLADPPTALVGPLILRVLRPYRDSGQIRLEAAVQNALAAQGYPVPRALLVDTDSTALGGAFMVMQRADGAPLASGFDNLVSGAGGARVVRLLRDVPRLMERVIGAWVEAQVRLHALPVGPVIDALQAAGVPLDTVTFDGRLATLRRIIAEANLGGLIPAVDWLRANRPAPPAAPSLCHCDLHPLNILAVDGRVTAVLDWGNATIGDPALDVGSTIASLATAPFDVPAGLRPVVRSALRYTLWRYRCAYGRRRAVAVEAVRYYQVFRSLSNLAGALRSAGQDGAPAGAHHLPGARQLLAARIRRLSGVTVALPA